MTEVHASSAGKEPVEGGNVGMGTQYLEVRGLTVDFDGFKAVSDVDLTLFQGDLRFLIGPASGFRGLIEERLCSV